MNEFQDAIYEAAQDNIAMLQNRLDSNSKIVQADDCIKIIAPVKKPNGRRLSVSDDFITTMLDDDTCNRTITGYQHISTGVYFKKTDLTAKANLDLYKPVYQLTVKLDLNTTIIYDRNNITICILKLAHYSKSRYRALIDVLTKSDIFVHNIRKDQPTKKTEYNNNRQILQRDFTMRKYEWSFTLNPEISRAILPAIKRLAMTTINGYYALYDTKRAQCSVKVYNITAIQPDRKNHKYQFLPNDLLKVEITYKSEYFRSRPELSIATFKKQRDSFIALQSDNMRIFKDKLLDKMKPAELKKVLTAAKVKTKSELMNRLKEESTMQTRIDIIEMDIRSKMDDLKNQIAQNKVEAKAYTDEKSAENKAYTDAKFDSMFDQYDQFLNFQTAKKDSRKLRLV